MSSSQPESHQPSDPLVAEAVMDPKDFPPTIRRLAAKVNSLKEEIRKCLVGQQPAVDAVMYALLSRGHALIEGVPGLGKTLLVRAVARLMDLSFSRVQFTPDLMPADITGSVILQVDDDGRRRFEFIRGPVFTHILLADEINRTPPKTQAALLESMQERTVTVSGQTHRLEEPFIVLATQNPIEQEGTYPLPEAQLDRFLFQIQIEYPNLEEERQIVEQHSFEPLERLKPVMNQAEILQYRQAVENVPAAPNVIDYAARLVRATRPKAPEVAPSVKKWVRWGGSPRATLNLILAGRARAACEGRFNVACEDVVAIAPLVLRHRIIRSFHADAEAISTDDIVARIVEETPQDS